jgi:phenylpropionate dioxygenase-like ring-hydroxylating dioxygenase large terminal subunit
MRHERQVELLRRLAAADAPRPGPLGAASMHNPASVYTSPERFEAEMRVLFNGMPQLAGLSCEAATPGSYLTTTAGRVPVLVVRQPDGGVKAFVNICRHRGSILVRGPIGEGLRKITCPYHAWTYSLDGCLRSFPGAEAGFDDIDKTTHGLIELPIAERYGLIFVKNDPAAAPFTVDEALHGAQEELADFDLERNVHIDTRVHEWQMNWKLVMDTFTEPYHIPWLHKDSIAPYYLFDRWINDTYGPHPRFIGTKKSVAAEFEKPDEDDWELLPHGTIQYLLVPNAVLVHQVDHVELWRLVPLAVDRTMAVTSIFAPSAPVTDKARAYFVKNLDVLLGVTNAEDFPAQEQVQRNMASGAMPAVVYGKMEPALVHYHTAINKLLADAGELI